MSKIKSPAYKNMSKEQLEASIELGQDILRGEKNLVDLDNLSLELRGKGKHASGKASGKVPRVSTGKRKRQDLDTENEARKISGASLAKPAPEHLETKDKNTSVQGLEATPGIVSESTASVDGPSNPTQVARSKGVTDDLTPFLKKIALSDKTAFQKKVLTALCQVPRGRYTTYAAISKHLASSPRAVGNALRNNPFAPQVPCHRVLASGGAIGGFGGSWGRNGKEGLNDRKKRSLLRDEGVKFDGKGKVVGSPWEAFK